MTVTRPTICWIAASLATAWGCGLAAPTGLVVNSDTQNTSTEDSLYSVDLETGAATLRGRLPTIYEDIEGLAFDATGVLYGIDDSTKSLIRVDPESAIVNPVGGLRGNLAPLIAFGTSADPAIAFTCDGRLLAVTAAGKLYQIDPGSGVPSAIGGSGATMPVKAITDIAVRGNEVYGLGVDRLYLINASNGTAKGIGTFGSVANFGSGGGMSFDANGTLWAIADRATSGNSTIYRINTQTGAATLVSTAQVDGVESLAIAPTQCTVEGEQTVVQIPASGRLGVALLGSLFALFGGLTLLRRR